MGNVMSVAVAERFHDLDKDLAGILLGKVAVRIEAVEELSSLAKTVWMEWYSVTRNTF